MEREEQMDTWLAVEEERSALADDLAALDDAQWNAQSLCSEWKVRHVVGHLIAGADLKTVPFLVGVIKSGMNFNRYIGKQGLAVGTAAPDDLLRQFKNTIGLQVAPKGAPPEVMLLDLVCHSVDIRRPTGLTRVVPEPSLRRAADLVKDVGTPLQAKKRIAGLRLSASDTDWSTGDGPSVEGPLASLILVMAGRRALLEDLSGEGLETMGARLG
ncbi:MAG TPA: maleylpyruvate isomerase family mycothiol-dependent enzyme [Acidimicrobiales bacterium]|nr:maleylpyruvate isomerase family mycothiol-dependent enzyme [Acidimicrobiales bacterium]